MEYTNINPNVNKQPRDYRGRWIKTGLPSDSDYIMPYQDYVLPNIPDSFLERLNKPKLSLVLKQNIILKNKKHHPDVDTREYNYILTKCIYNADIVGVNNDNKNYYSFIKYDKEKNMTALVELQEEKGQYEIVNFHYLREKSLKTLLKKIDIKISALMDDHSHHNNSLCESADEVGFSALNADNNIINDNSNNFNPIITESKEDNNMYEEEINNAKDWAKTYTGESIMYEGIATYQNESIYLSKETLKKCMPELKGRPVIIEHKLGINPGNMEEYAVGYVTKCEYNNETGDFDCDFVVWDEEAKKLLKNDYTLSTSYIAKEFANGGTFINTPYDKEVTKLAFTHLAIVKNPRYEKVKVYQNSLDVEEVEILDKMSEFNNDIKEEKETVMSEKIEVEQSFLTALLSRVAEICNSKKCDNEVEEEIKKGDEIENEEVEEKKEKNAEDLEDAVEEEAEEKDNKCEKANEVEEEELENSIDEGVDWFDKMQELMNSVDRSDDKLPLVASRELALEKGKKIFG